MQQVLSTGLSAKHGGVSLLMFVFTVCSHLDVVCDTASPPSPVPVPSCNIHIEPLGPQHTAASHAQPGDSPTPGPAGCCRGAAVRFSRCAAPSCSACRWPHPSAHMLCPHCSKASPSILKCQQISLGNYLLHLLSYLMI